MDVVRVWYGRFGGKKNRMWWRSKGRCVNVKVLSGGLHTILGGFVSFRTNTKFASSEDVNPHQTKREGHSSNFTTWKTFPKADYAKKEVKQMNDRRNDKLTSKDKNRNFSKNFGRNLNFVKFNHFMPCWTKAQKLEWCPLRTGLKNSFCNNYFRTLYYGKI